MFKEKTDRDNHEKYATFTIKNEKNNTKQNFRKGLSEKADITKEYQDDYLKTKRNKDQVKKRNQQKRKI